MKFPRIAFLAALLIAAGSLAYAQVTAPRVTTVHPGVDIVQVIPNGSIQAGNVYATVSQLLGGNTTTGLTGFTLPVTSFKNVDGTTLAVSASSGKFGLTLTPGTATYLITEAANSNTKTDDATIEVVLPASYIAGTNITVTANTNYTLGAGTVGTHTLAAAAYLTAAAGTQGTTLIATTAQSVPATAGNVTFTITGASLVPGSRLTLDFTLVIQDTGGSNVTARVNSVALS